MYFLTYIDMYVIGTTIMYQLSIVTAMLPNRNPKDPSLA